MNNIIAIDPGTKKCGLLIADISRNHLIDAKVVTKDEVINLIVQWSNQYSFQLIIIGNGTNSKYWVEKLEKNKLSPIELVEEKGTTLRARTRYWEIYPPGFFLSLIPKGMLLPPKNLDSIAALVLLEDYLQKKLSFSDNLSFKIWPEQ